MPTKSRVQQFNPSVGDSITEEESSLILKLQMSILEQVAQNRTKKSVLANLCLMAEELLDNAVASIMIKDESGLLNITSAPSIPPEGIKAFNGLQPAPNGGSCGTAVYLNEPVFIIDTATDRRAEAVRDTLGEFKLCSCWSMPIRNARNEAIGAFGLSSFEQRAPTPFYRLLLEVGANIIAIVIRQSEQDKELKSKESTLQVSRAAVRNASECIFVTDTDFNIIEINPAFEEVYGYTAPEILAENANVLLSPETDGEIFQDKIRTNPNWQGELFHQHRDGTQIPVSVSVSAISDAAGIVTNHLFICRDLTELKEQKRALEYLAFNDPLTGLANRTYLFERIKLATHRARRNGTQFAVLYLDLDRFKNLNDTFGHSMGDQVLVKLADRLKVELRAQDTLARIGGDEFIIIIEDSAGTLSVYGVAEKILEALKAPIECEGERFLLSGSIGIAIFPDDASDPEEIIKFADTAMYDAKKSVGSHISFYNETLTKESRMAFTMEGDLRRALEDNEFELYYQPKVDAKSLSITGYEALIRWHHPEKGMVSPADFIPIAEQTGLIAPIGEWVLKDALRKTQEWLGQNARSFVTSVNISGCQMTKDRISRIIEILQDSEVPGENIELELTETFLMAEPESSVEFIKSLKATGVRVAIDDFGSGYSSLGYLKRFDVDTLKLDRFLTRDIETDPHDMAIVKAVTLMGTSLGLSVVAEGVETIQQVELLREAGCQELQGFHFFKPMPAEEISKLFEVSTLSE